jgi:hypothetical protein
MRILIFLTILIFSTLSPPAFASCGQVAQDIFARHVFFKTTTDCEFLAEVLEPLQNVSKFFNRNLDLTLVIQERGNNASFDSSQIIWLPKNLYSYDQNSNAVYANRKDLSAILLHELGHALLNKRLEVDLRSEFGELFSQINDVSNKMLRILEFGHKPSMSALRIGDHISETTTFQKYLKYVVSYTELYADTVAVLYFNDPDIMYQSLEFATHSPLELPFIQGRSFSRHDPIPNSVWNENTHTQFTPVRRFIGRILNSPNLNRMRLLKALEDALVDQIKEEIRLGDLPNMEIRNSNLIYKFAIRLRK